MSDAADPTSFEFQDDFPVSPEWFNELVPMAFARARCTNVVSDPSGRSATAQRDVQLGGALVKRETVQIVLEWAELAPNRTRARWGSFDYTLGRRGNPHPKAGAEFRNCLRATVYGVPEPESAPLDPVVGPGEVFDGRFRGNLKDYSFFSTAEELGNFERGSLPLGVHAWPQNGTITYGKRLFLSDFASGPMMYNGVLVCAPQNSGKTQLLLRWANAANRAGFNLFVVDVKGNMLDKLSTSSWRGPLFRLTTDPRPPEADPPSDRINFLSGYLDESCGFTAETTDRVKQLVSALLSSQSFKGQGGKEEWFFRFREIWTNALIHILLLRQFHQPERFKDCRRVNEACRKHPCQESRDACRNGLCERTMDLGDLYELAGSEQQLASVIADLRKAEAAARARPDAKVPECGIDYWVQEIAIALDPAKVAGGQRPPNETYQQYTAGIMQTLEPFAKHGTLHARIRDNGRGRLFRLEDLMAEPPDDPVTVILVARQQDHVNAETVLALAIARLQHILFDRMRAKQPRPLLLLLDETRRIHGFEANQYITFAREAKAGCVVVYQSIDQIGDEKQIQEVLENVGTQIYLSSLVGSTARHFIELMPKRYRSVVTSSVQRSSTGIVQNETHQKELIESFSTNELYRLPAGQYPALVYVTDQPRSKPFLVDMDEGISLGSLHTDWRLVGHSPSLVCDLALLPDQEWVLAGCADHAIRLWRITDSADPRVLLPKDGGGRCCAISADASLLAAGGDDGRISIHDNLSNEVIAHIEAHADAVTCLAFVPGSETVLSGSKDHTIAAHAARNGTVINLLTAHAAPLTGLCVSKDGALIVTASLDGKAYFWSYSDWSQQAAVSMMKPIVSLAASSDLTAILLATDASVLLCEERGAARRVLVDAKSSATCVAVSPDGSVMVAGYGDSSLQVWTRGGKTLLATVQLASIPARVVVPDDNSQVLIALSDGTLQSFLLETLV